MTGSLAENAFRLRSKLIYLAWTPLLVAIDQYSKIVATRELDRYCITWLNGIVRIVYARNEGAFGSLGAGLSEGQRFWLLTVGNAVLLTGLMGYLLLRKDVTRYQFIAFGLIFVGGIGNLIDRARHGFVIDFMNVGIGWLRTNIFNIADMYIVLGFALLVPVFFRGTEPSRLAEGRANSDAKQRTVTPVS